MRNVAIIVGTIIGSTLIIGCEDAGPSDIEVLSANHEAYIYVDGDVAGSKLDTVGSPVIVKGDITNSPINTAAMAGDDG
jgi:hypothetical protein